MLPCIHPTLSYPSLFQRRGRANVDSPSSPSPLPTATGAVRARPTNDRASPYPYPCPSFPLPKNPSSPSSKQWLQGERRERTHLSNGGGGGRRLSLLFPLFSSCWYGGARRGGGRRRSESRWSKRAESGFPSPPRREIVCSCRGLSASKKKPPFAPPWLLHLGPPPRCSSSSS